MCTKCLETMRELERNAPKSTDIAHLVTLLCEQAEETASALNANMGRLTTAKLPGFAVDAHDLADLAAQVRHALSTLEAH